MFDEIYYLLFFSKTIKFIESQLSGARAYLCGHDHGYAHARIDDGDGDYSNDVHQFVVGTAGAGVNIKPMQSIGEFLRLKCSIILFYHFPAYSTSFSKLTLK